MAIPRARARVDGTTVLDRSEPALPGRVGACERRSRDRNGSAPQARELGIDVPEAAREGLREAVRRHRAERDRAAYLAHPEAEDSQWDRAEAWGDT